MRPGSQAEARAVCCGWLPPRLSGPWADFERRTAISEWKVDATKILSGAEIGQVLADLKRRAKRSVNSRMNLIIFRLATCCGLRVSEMIGLRVGDVRVGVPKPYLNLRREITKRHKPRRVPLWWDQGTLDDLTAWREHRLATGATSGDFLLCSQSAKKGTGSAQDPPPPAGNALPRGACPLSRRTPRPLDRQNARHRFKVACRVLGPQRVRELTIHHGRHTFCSHAAKLRTLAEVRDAAGHSNIATTNIYLHIVTDDDGEVGGMLAFVR